MAEGAPLLRAYTLIAYRGFESLFLRQIKKPPFKGAFLFAKNSGENPRGFDKMRMHFGRTKGAPQDLLASFSLLEITKCESILDARRAVRRTK